MLRCLLGILMGSVLALAPAWAQPRLAQARQTSYFTTAYRLSEAQVRHLYEKGLKAATPTFFTQPADAFPTDSPALARRRLPTGYYLVAHAQGPELRYWLRAVTDREIALLDNQTDLLLTVRDTLGRLLPGAEVRLHGRRLPYDSLTRTYRRPRGGRAGLLAISWQGRTTYHQLERSFKGASGPGYALRNVYHRVLWRRPLGYLTWPVRHQLTALSREVGNLLQGRENDGERPGLLSLLRSPFSEDVRDERESWREQQRDRREQRWMGFVVTSQPRYRPQGDTLLLKARVLRRRNGRPSRRPLTLTLSRPDGVRKTVLLQPQQPGTYVYSLPITDSLGWRPDSRIDLRLGTARSARVRGSFRLEDYELPATRYQLRVLAKSQQRGQPQAFFVRGTDFNDLNLLDARVRLAVVARQVGEAGPPRLFVPDTLWTHTQALDPVGETRMELPARVLPPADFSYQVVAAFLNADQERHVETATVRYRLDAGRLRLRLAADSVLLDFAEAGQPRPHEAVLEGWGADTTAAPLFRQVVRLPLARPLDTRLALLRLRDATGRTARLPLPAAAAGVQLQWERQADSLFIAIDNPRRLLCWYFVYRHKRLLRRGYSSNLRLALPAGPIGTPWHVSLHYQGWSTKNCPNSINAASLRPASAQSSVTAGCQRAS